MMSLAVQDNGASMDRIDRLLLPLRLFLNLLGLTALLLYASYFLITAISNARALVRSEIFVLQSFRLQGAVPVPGPEIAGIALGGPDWVWWLLSILGAIALAVGWLIPWAKTIIQEWQRIISQWVQLITRCPWFRSWRDFFGCFVRLIWLVFITLQIIIATLLWIVIVLAAIILVIINIVGLISLLF